MKYPRINNNHAGAKTRSFGTGSIYGSYFREFEGRFLGALEKRTFEQRTLRYGDLREMMEEARPMILEKAAAMGK